MCGRYAFDDIKEIYEARKILDDISANLGEETAATVKTGEIFPTETAAVIAQNANGYSANVMAWGYPISSSKRNIINARSETLTQKPFFAKSLDRKRCLIPCTGFFEWEKGGKQKYLIRPKTQGFFYLAGIYNTFSYVDSAAQNRFVIITAPANDSMSDIHHRMPLIVPKTCVDMWFEKNTHYNALIRRIYDMTVLLEKKAV